MYTVTNFKQAEPVPTGCTTLNTCIHCPVYSNQSLHRLLKTNTKHNNENHQISSNGGEKIHSEALIFLDIIDFEALNLYFLDILDFEAFDNIHSEALIFFHAPAYSNWFFFSI